MRNFKFTNKGNGRTMFAAVDNVSKKFVTEYLSGEMSLRQFAFYLDGKSRHVHEQLHQLGITEYDDMEIEVLNKDKVTWTKKKNGSASDNGLPVCAASE